VTGLVLRMALDKGLGGGRIFWGIAPHGILEVPAILLSAALGLRTGFRLLFPRGKSRLKAVSEAFREASAFYVLFVFPLIIVAAFVEVLVSKRIIAP